MSAVYIILRKYIQNCCERRSREGGLTHCNVTLLAVPRYMHKIRTPCKISTRVGDKTISEGLCVWGN